MNTRDKVIDMLDDFDTAMMITHAPSGPLDCRPMHVAKSDLRQGGPLWFITSAESQKVMEIAHDATTLLIFQEGDRYVAVWGRSTVSQDRDRIDELWREPYRAWFPQGVGDPDIRLVTVTPHSAEFWDNAGANKLRYVFEATKAYAAGERVEPTEDSHGRTNL